MNYESMSAFSFYFLFLCSIGSVTSGRPNVVFILTDDQDVVLNGLTPLEKTRKLIGEEGCIFENAFATTPICCPSRSSILTGLYQHSHGTVNNSLEGGCSDAHWQRKHEPDTFGAVLRRAGYRTFYAGKYLNRYGFRSSGGVQHVPEGWDWWIGLVGNSAYYNYTLSVNGSKVARGEDESDYLTDVLKKYSLMFLNERLRNDPFLMVVSTTAPHEPFSPARRHVGRFSNLTAPRTPNFNRPVPDTKHWLLRLPPNSLPSEVIADIDRIFRNRWETLLAVDELVEAIVKRLEELQALENTFIIVSSDHGFHLGQFGQPWDKRQPYETDIRIPLMLRGPNVLRNRKIRYPVLTIDIAPTILEMAGMTAGRERNGRSFLSVATSEPKKTFSRTFLVEYQGEGEKKENDSCYDDPNLKLCDPRTSCKCFDSRNNTFLCLRHLSVEADDIYCRFDDSESFREFYDMRKDPYQMENLSRTPKAEIRRFLLEDCMKKMESRSEMAVDDCFEPVPEIIRLP